MLVLLHTRGAWTLPTILRGPWYRHNRPHIWRVATLPPVLDLPSNYEAVTATSYDLRFASYEIKLDNDDHSGAIPDVRFSEYQDAPAGKPWAKWDCDSRGTGGTCRACAGKVNLQSPMRIDFLNLALNAPRYRYPQQIEYIQLEKGDVWMQGTYNWSPPSRALCHRCTIGLMSFLAHIPMMRLLKLEVPGEGVH